MGQHRQYNKITLLCMNIKTKSVFLVYLVHFLFQNDLPLMNVACATELEKKYIPNVPSEMSSSHLLFFMND